MARRDDIEGAGTAVEQADVRGGALHERPIPFKRESGVAHTLIVACLESSASTAGSSRRIRLS